MRTTSTLVAYFSHELINTLYKELKDTAMIFQPDEPGGVTSDSFQQWMNTWYMSTGKHII